MRRMLRILVYQGTVSKTGMSLVSFFFFFYGWGARLCSIDHRLQGKPPATARP